MCILNVVCVVCGILKIISCRRRPAARLRRLGCPMSRARERIEMIISNQFIHPKLLHYKTYGEVVSEKLHD